MPSKICLTLCFTILFKLNAYSLDMRALKKVTRQFSASQRGSLVPMKTLGWPRTIARIGLWGFGTEASSMSIRYKIGRADRHAFFQPQLCEQEARNANRVFQQHIDGNPSQKPVACLLDNFLKPTSEKIVG